MPNQKPNKKPKSNSPKKQISESPIREISETPMEFLADAFSGIGTPSPFFTEDDVKETMMIDKVVNALSNDMKLYTIDDMIDVWCRAVTNGATLWQYCQDTSRPLPSSFEAGLLELVNEIRHSDDKAYTLQQMLNNNMLLLGVFDEKL